VAAVDEVEQIAGAGFAQLLLEEISEFAALVTSEPR
jgi:hypothetical protein